MKIISEESVRNFGFWQGGADRAKDIKSNADWDIIESNLEEMYPDGMTDSELNDFFWFDFDTIAQWLGYKGEEHYFYGAAKNNDEMFDVISDKFPNANEDAIIEWVETEWNENWIEGKCYDEFEEWYYTLYAKDRTTWVDSMFEQSEGPVCQMKWFIKDKDLNEKTAEEWLEEFNQWLEDEADWIEEHEEEIYSTDYGF